MFTKLLFFIALVLLFIAFVVNYPPAGVFATLNALSWFIAASMAIVLAWLLGPWLDAQYNRRRVPPA